MLTHVDLEFESLEFDHIRAGSVCRGMVIALPGRSPKRVVHNDDGYIVFEGDFNQAFEPDDALKLVGETYIVNCQGLPRSTKHALYLIRSFNSVGGIVEYVLDNGVRFYASEFMASTLALSQTIQDAIQALREAELESIAPIVFRSEIVGDDSELKDLFNHQASYRQEPSTGVDIVKFENKQILGHTPEDEKLPPSKRVNKSITARAYHNAEGTTETCLFTADNLNSPSQNWVASVTIHNDEDKSFSSVSAATMDLGRKLSRVGEALIKKGRDLDDKSPLA